MTDTQNTPDDTVLMTSTEATVMSLMTRMLDRVKTFNRDVIGYPTPDVPTVLPANRLEFRSAHLTEEHSEFAQASAMGDLPGAADALIDLIYVAMGCLVEMGCAPEPIFEEVHSANMAKTRGAVSKRGASEGYDAVKPEGWKPPDHAWLVGMKWADIVEGAAAQDVLTRLRSLVGSDANAEDLLRHVLGMRDRVRVLDAMSPVLVEVAALRAKKGEDYNSGPRLTDYFPFGHYSYAQMLHLKNLRVQSLIAVQRQGRQPNFEGLRDTLTDLINYTTFYVEALDRGDLDGERPNAA